jgi:hypothetical protein
MLYIIVGKKGHGKSTFVKQKIENNFHEKFFVVDINNEYKKARNLRKFNSTLEMIVQGAKQKNVNLIFEEYHSLTPEEVNLTERLIRLMRHYNITIFLLTHRIYDITPLIRNMVDHLIIFRLQEKRDKDYISNFIDQDINFNIEQFSYYHYNCLSDNIEKNKLSEVKIL